LAALTDSVQSEFGTTALGRTLATDLKELSQALTDFQTGLPKTGDPFRLRRAYAGVDTSWHYLQAQLGRPELANAKVARAATVVAQRDDEIHRALDMNGAPANYYEAATAIVGMPQIQRLTHALVDRADALAAIIRQEAGGNTDVRTVQEATNLAQQLDIYHDALNLSGRVDIPRRGFGGITALSTLLKHDLFTNPVSPRIQAAWHAYKSAEVLLRADLGLANDPEDLPGTAIPAEGPPPVAAVADRLAGQVDAYVQLATTGAIPGGPELVADAQRLQVAVADFRQDAHRALNAAQLAFEFRDVDALWQRLARRLNRLTRARIAASTVPQARAIGESIAKIHELLALPGYAPSVESTPEPT
jgi:hypothetical protein